MAIKTPEQYYESLKKLYTPLPIFWGKRLLILRIIR